MCTLVQPRRDPHTEPPQHCPPADYAQLHRARNLMLQSSGLRTGTSPTGSRCGSSPACALQQRCGSARSPASASGSHTAFEALGRAAAARGSQLGLRAASQQLPLPPSSHSATSPALGSTSGRASMSASGPPQPPSRLHGDARHTAWQEGQPTACVPVAPADLEPHSPSSATAALRSSGTDGGSQGPSLAHIQHDPPLGPREPEEPAGPSAAAHAALARAAALLAADLPVAMPTETVYGLAGNALSADAVRRVFAAKGRPSDNPLIVHVSSLDMLQSLYPEGWELPPVYRAVLAACWPGPLTVLLPRSPRVPQEVTCGQPTMAVRLPSHPVARALIAACGFPLAAPSANSSGRPSPTLAAHVMEDLAGRIPLVLDGGPCPCGVESTVLDALRQPPVVLRPGGVTPEQLRGMPGLEGLLVYQRDFVDAKLEQAPTTPGMKYRHYSPRAQVVLIEVEGWQGSEQALQRRAELAVAEQVAQLRGQGVERVAVMCSTAGPGEPPGPVAAAEAGPASAAATGASSSGGGGDSGSGDGGAGAGSPVLRYVLGPLGQPEAVARELFRALRWADEQGVQAVVVEGVFERGEGLAVMNRLRKAATRTVHLAGGCS